MGGRSVMLFTQVCVVRPAGFTSPKMTSAKPLPNSWLLLVRCKIDGTFSCDQLMANGKLLTNTITVLGLACVTSFTKSSCSKVIALRSTPSLPSLGTGETIQRASVPYG